MTSTRLVVAGFALLVAACSSSSSTGGASPVSDGGAVDGSVGDAGVSGDDSATSGDAYNPNAPVVATAGIGPIPVAAGGETTLCIEKRLTTTESILVTRMVADLSPGSHHLIVYQSTGTTEQLTPFACQPFEGLVSNTAVPLMLVGEEHVDYGFPVGVGMTVPAGQMLRVEAHYINTTSAAIQGMGNVQLEGLPLAAAGTFIEANFGFWGTLDIDIPANSTFSTPVLFQPGIAGTTVFTVSSHQHHLGTEVKVWMSADAGDTSDPILDETNWAAPALEQLTPPITFDGTNGFSYQCSWDNTTSSAVMFGESANDEMCFVGLYYYPSHGFDKCFDGTCPGR
jgi:Copper type II ascorbate-dependent monooxygenase, C-terminal domain